MKKAAILILVLLNVGLVTALLVNSAKPAQAQIGGGSSYMVVAGHMGGNIGTENDGLYITDVVKKKLIVFKYDTNKKSFVAITGRKIEGDFPKP